MAITISYCKHAIVPSNVSQSLRIGIDIAIGSNMIPYGHTLERVANWEVHHCANSLGTVVLVSRHFYLPERILLDSVPLAVLLLHVRLSSFMLIN